MGNKQKQYEVSSCCLCNNGNVQINRRIDEPLIKPKGITEYLLSSTVLCDIFTYLFKTICVVYTIPYLTHKPHRLTYPYYLRSSGNRTLRQRVYHLQYSLALESPLPRFSF